MSQDGTGIVATFEPLSASQRRGAIVVATFALLSALALAFIALRTIRLAVVLFPKHDSATSRPPEILFFRTQLGHYAGCLILSNMLICAAGLIDFSWVIHSGLSRGATCSAQAILMEIGIWSTCWFTSTLGVHTLGSLGFHIRPARWRSSVFVVLGWSIAFAAALAPLRNGNVYGPNGTSCGVTASYPKELYVVEALPIILGTLVSTAAYSVIFIVLHGKLNTKSSRKLRYLSSTSQQGEDTSEEYYKFISIIIWTMFWFPFAFVLLLLPFCITHILMFAERSPSYTLSVFADACVSMLGFVNVVLLCNTFRVIRPVSHNSRATKVVAETVKTFGHDASAESPIVPKPIFSSQPPVPSYKSAPVFHDVMRPETLTQHPSLESNTKRQDIIVQPESAIGSLLRVASLGPCSPRVPFVKREVRHGCSTQDEPHLLQPTSDMEPTGNGAQEQTFKPRALPTPNPPRLLTPRFEADTWNPDHANKSHPRPYSSSSSAPTLAVSNDSDSEYSVDAVRARKVRPLPKIPEPNNDEEDTLDPCLLTPRRLRGQSAMTVTTVWSQESGYTLSQSSDTESQEAHRQLVVDAVLPGPDHRTHVGEVMSRQANPPSAYGYHSETHLRPLRLSTRFTNTLSPIPQDGESSTMVFAANDSFV